jgi:hypothetical protein
MLGTDVAKEVLKLVNSKDPMKKYLLTDKGKVAKKKANQKYFWITHGKTIHGDADDVKLQLADEIVRLSYEGHESKTDEGDLAWLKLHPKIFRTGSELWKAYSNADGCPSMTRIRYISLLPPFETEPSHVRNGKRIYKPVFVINAMDYYQPCDS